MKLTEFQTDPKVRDEGVWVRLPGADDDEARLKVRPETYGPYRRAITRIVEKNNAMGRFSRRQGSTLGDPVQFDIERGRAIAKHLLVNWEGLEDENNQPLPYSQETAERILTDHDRYYEFYLAVGEAIEQVSSAKKEWEEDRGNSSLSESNST